MDHLLFRNQVCSFNYKFQQTVNVVAPAVKDSVGVALFDERNDPVRTIHACIDGLVYNKSTEVLFGFLSLAIFTWTGRSSRAVSFFIVILE
jgi:hypothetical protein